MSEKSSSSQQAQGSYIAQATGGSTATVQVVLPPPAVQEQNRVRFLKRLRVLYEDLWKQSLQGAAQLTLGLTEKPEVILHHTELLLRAPQQPQRPLPEGTTLLEVYDEAGQELLLLGEPGAGKSTLLLELARRLVERAEQDPGHPLPVLLPFSSWAVKQVPLSEWLPAQLALIYDMPRQLSRNWVQTDQILPLLDGLDEVPQEARVACIEAINTYRKEHLVPLVVCSRRAEYEQLASQERLVLHSAVVIEPLTKQQVETYLNQVGPSLAAVHTVLQANPVLQELTTTPLMLSVLTLTYAGVAVQDLPQHGSADVQEQQVFAAYVERMVARKGDVIRYPLERTKVWLGWLAQQMRQHSQTIFYLEQLQPDWLADRLRHDYRLSIVLVWLVLGLVHGLLSGLLLMLSVEVFSGQFSGLDGLLSGLFFGLFSGLVGGLFFGLVGLRFALSPISPGEVLTWSWRKAGLGIVYGLASGLGFWLLLGLFGALFFGLLSGLFFGLLGGLVGLLSVLPLGLSAKQIDERLRLRPNQGIWRSARNGLIVWLGGLGVGLAVGLLSVLPGGLLSGSELSVDLGVGLGIGLFGGLFGGLVLGLGAFLQHFTLRFWLVCFPWKAVPFLEDATTRILLRRVGGGYSFVHRLILDYFADLEPTALTPAATQPPTAMKAP